MGYLAFHLKQNNQELISPCYLAVDRRNQYNPTISFNITNINLFNIVITRVSKLK